MTVVRRMALGVLGLAMFTTACSGDDDSAGTSAPDEQGAVEDDTRTDAERQADEQAATAALLTIDDFPAGWEATPATDDDDEANDELRNEVADCLDVDRALLDNDNPRADSPSFKSPDEVEVSSEVALTPSADAASRTLDIMKSEAMPGCYAQTIKGVLERNVALGAGGDVEIGEPTFNPISFPDMGDDSVAFRLTVPLASQGVNVDLTMDVVMVRVGRAGVTTTFQSTFSPFDSAEAARLTQLVVDRIPADVAG